MNLKEKILNQISTMKNDYKLIIEENFYSLSDDYKVEISMDDILNISIKIEFEFKDLKSIVNEFLNIKYRLDSQLESNLLLELFSTNNAFTEFPKDYLDRKVPEGKVGAERIVQEIILSLNNHYKKTPGFSIMDNDKITISISI